jgi:hypothetical protein
VARSFIRCLRARSLPAQRGPQKRRLWTATNVRPQPAAGHLRKRFACRATSRAKARSISRESS